MTLNFGPFFNLMPDWQQEHLVALREQMALNARDPKYQKITLALSFAESFNPLARFFPGRPLGIAPGIWIAYHFCRRIDDLADGDSLLPSSYASFRDLSIELNNAMTQNKYPKTTEGILLRGTVRDFRDYRGVDLRNEISKFLNAMKFESSRRLMNTVSSRDELYRLYQDSFGVPQDIAFIGFGSKVRSNNLSELADLQGRIYAIRDLPEDLPKGRIFVPTEVMPNGVSGEEAYGLYNSNPSVFDEWIQEELRAGSRLVEKIDQKELDRRGRLVVNSLTGGIKKYISKNQRAFTN